MIIPKSASLADKLLGNPLDTTLEGRIFNVITLISLAMGMLCVIGFSLVSRWESVAMCTFGSMVIASCYLFARRSGKWQKVALPGCLMYLGILTIDWIFDPSGIFASDGYYFFMLAIFSAIILAKKQKTPFIILIGIVLVCIFLREALFPVRIRIYAKPHLFMVIDNGLTLLMGIVAMVVVVRIVLGEYQRVMKELRNARDEIKTLRGLLPICSKCKKIRDDIGEWNSIEEYIERNTAAEFTHGLCPDCMQSMYDEIQTTLQLRTEPQNPDRPFGVDN